jgi:DNA-binding transcriptional regulator YiaG
MARRTLLDWADLERELHAARVPAEEIEAGARRLLARARGQQLAETRKQLGLGQKQIAAAMSVSVARVSQIEHGEVQSREHRPELDPPRTAPLVRLTDVQLGRAG